MGDGVGEGVGVGSPGPGGSGPSGGGGGGGFIIRKINQGNFDSDTGVCLSYAAILTGMRILVPTGPTCKSYTFLGEDLNI